jgi:fructokinase
VIEQLRIGVDLGGTKIEAIALSPDGVVLDQRRVATPNSYAGAIAAISDIVAAVERAVGVSRVPVGIGTPGSASPVTGLWRNSNALFLNGTQFGTDLPAALKRPVRIENDANCFVLSEARDGAAAGRRVVFGVTLGTGLGGGLVFDGGVHRGANAVAGEAGHIPLPWPTEHDLPLQQCYCGKLGCVERYVSGPGLARDYARLTGADAGTGEIVAGLGRGDAAARIALDLFFDRLARLFGVVVTLIDPDVIVVGGGLSSLPGLVENVSAAIPRYVFGGEGRVPVLLAKHGESSGVRGAAALWDDSSATVGAG